MPEARKEYMQKMIETLASISEPCEAGVQRQSYSKEYKAGVEFVRREMEAIGLSTSEDPVGNLYGRLDGKEPGLPMILSGSHLDTVRCAGAFDGIAGVVCAMEAAHMIKESGEPLRHPFFVFGTIGEEGTRFGQVVLGSQFMAGQFGEKQLDELTGVEDGRTLREAMKEYGLSGDLNGVSLREKPIKAFVELHGEQGPVLEAEQTDIGIVETIAGIIWLEVTVTGQANHSGTVPMKLRKDAGIGAFAMITGLNEYVTEHYSGKATMTAGQLKLMPGSSNCIPGQCIFTLDIRSGRQEFMDDILEQVNAWEKKLAERGLKAQIKELSRRKPIQMDGKIQEYMEKTCGELQYSFRRLDSGAGHDSMIFALYWPTAMLFLPNRDGISHNPAEYIDYNAMKKGTEVLYKTIRKLDQED